MMKRYIIFALITIFVTLSHALSINPQWKKFQGLKYRDNCANFEEGCFDSITGFFDGQNEDTLTLYPFDGQYETMGESGEDIFYYDKWIVISKYGTVPSHIIDSFYPELIYEGDLDLNGKDEFGVLHTGQAGCWWTYSVHTLYQGKVKEFTSFLYHYDEDIDLHDLVKRGKEKGKIVILKGVDDSDRDDFCENKPQIRTITKFFK